ncbi:hypothetical protein CUT44_08230 [Streptomyces carminius]|uniref:CdiI immunity protein domain-containing protein n=1 Tax=Streptomyces carminius TaxID=2665496 RepID=A0A2M8M214_9ACTN|nr:contact-dependent growth inhibition system immunity protein [Streptomyces carminius]PJE98246.1 hypothetical protein CUT44_08230 [Streptomyces carminius]
MAEYSAVPGFRFSEVQELLAAYTEFDYVFTDTPEEPGPALESYLRVALRSPERAGEALRQIEDLLTVGLFSPEIEDEVDLLPRVRPTDGRNVEESFRIIRGHLTAFLEGELRPPEMVPQRPWEWRERFPELAGLLGGYFHQDMFHEYPSHREAVDDYMANASVEERRRAVEELLELMRTAETDETLEEATEALGMHVYPPSGVELRQWLVDLVGVVKNYSGA